MKLFFFLVLLALTTSFDAAVVQEAGGIEGEKLRKGLKPATFEEASKTVESLGKLLRGGISMSTVEERDEVLEAIKALTISGEPEEGTEEYFLMLIAKAIAIGAASGALGAGGQHFMKWIKQKWQKG